MITIVKASKKELSDVLQLRYEMLQVVNGEKADFFDESFQSITEEYFSNGMQDTYIAFDSDIAIGCATLCYISLMPTYSHPTGKRAHVMNVYVKKEFRRKGIAKNMLQELIMEARKNGVTEISLDATEEGRPLYESLGFKENKEGMTINM